MPNWKMTLGSKEVNTPGNMKLPKGAPSVYGGKSIPEAIRAGKKK